MNTFLQPQIKEFEQIMNLICNLQCVEKRVQTLKDLASMKEKHSQFDNLIWYSYRTVTVLMEQIVLVYPYLSPFKLSYEGLKRLCFSIQILERLALNTKIRLFLLQANIPVYIFPFLNISSKSIFANTLKLSSISFMAALLIGRDNQKSINFLKTSQIIQLCLGIVRDGQTQCRVKSLFIISKILQDSQGLEFNCRTSPRFYSINSALNQVLQQIVSNNIIDYRLIKYLIRCYLHLSTHQKACKGIKYTIPQRFLKLPSYILVEQNVKQDYDEFVKNIKSIK